MTEKGELPTISTDEGDELDAFFAVARAGCPGPDQLARMLRGVPREGRSPRRILRWVGGGLATAATVAGVLIAWGLLGQQRPALAMEDIVAAMEQVPVCRTEYEDGDVVWTVPDRSIAGITADGNRAWFWDRQNNVRATYERSRGSVVLATTDAWEVESDAPIWAQRDPLEWLLQYTQRRNESFEEEWEIRVLVLDGSTQLVVERKDPDHLDWLHRFAIDERSRRLLWTEGPFGRTTYTYPLEWPQSVFDLGVPQDTPVLDLRAQPELLDLQREVTRSMSADLGPYCMVQFSTGRAKEVTYILWDGRRYRRDVIPVRLASADPMQIVETMQRTVHRDPSDKSSTQSLFDGEKELTLPAPHERFLVAQWPPAGTVGQTPLYWEIWLMRPGLFFGGGTEDVRFESVGPDENGWVGYARYGEANRISRPHCREAWFDPAREYVLAKVRRLTFPDAEWQLTPGWQDLYVRESHVFMNELPEAPPSGTESEVLEWAQIGEDGPHYPRCRSIRVIQRSSSGDWIETDLRFEDGYVLSGRAYRRVDGEVLSPPSHVEPEYEYLVVEPLETIDDEWFTPPAAWSDLPVKNY